MVRWPSAGGRSSSATTRSRTTPASMPSPGVLRGDGPGDPPAVAVVGGGAGPHGRRRRARPRGLAARGRRARTVGPRCRRRGAHRRSLSAPAAARRRPAGGVRATGVRGPRAAPRSAAARLCRTGVAEHGAYGRGALRGAGHPYRTAHPESRLRGAAVVGAPPLPAGRAADRESPVSGDRRTSGVNPGSSASG